VIRFLMAHQHN